MRTLAPHLALLALSGCHSAYISTGDGDLSDGDLSSDADAPEADAEVPGDPCAALLCPAGQDCVDGRCRAVDRCSGVVCGNPGDVCDPRDGACHAGAVDEDGDGYTLADGDCDDGASSIHPDAAELCDGVDQDCDYDVDEGFPDDDGDGFDTCGFGTAGQADCDDDDRRRHPGRDESCDGVDEDCDGVVDDGLAPRPCQTACAAGEERCEGGDWSCSAPVTCECTPPGSDEEEPCGLCGSRARACLDDLTWSTWGLCEGEGDCDPESETTCVTVCGSVGMTTCGEDCRWSALCEAPAEVCNGVDDDCDDDCDEGCRQPIHRSHNAALHDHLYTGDLSEATCCGYSLEFEGFFYLSSSQVPGTAALYQCLLASWDDHMLSRFADCEGGSPPLAILGYIATSPGCGAVPLYRIFDPVGLDHFYTWLDSELDTAVEGGWVYESIIGYVWTSP